MKKYTIAFCIIIFYTAINSCSKEDSMNTPSDVYFPTVKSIIQNHCLTCHSSTGDWAGRPVSFDTDTAIAEQYAFIKAAVSDPVTITNKRMPQDGMLSAEEINTIVKWFEKGGKISD